MERQVSEVLPPVEVSEEEARLLHDAEDAVRGYLQQLGFGVAAIDSVVPLCLAKARKRVAAARRRWKNCGGARWKTRNGAWIGRWAICWVSRPTICPIWRARARLYSWTAWAFPRTTC